MAMNIYTDAKPGAVNIAHTALRDRDETHPDLLNRLSLPVVWARGAGPRRAPTDSVRPKNALPHPFPMHKTLPTKQAELR